MPETGKSFALIYSVEDPLGNTANSSVAAQVMGPDDSYLVQYTRDVNTFWATPGSLGLGATFKTQLGARQPRAQLPPDAFDRSVDQGYQATTSWHQGRLVAAPNGVPGTLASTTDRCAWAFKVEPLSGWGDVGGEQKATAGWLAALPVFEPHWQVLMAHGLASGWFEWGGERYDFDNCPAYAEKNWGGGFPSKWVWVQCNTFEGEPGCSVTAVGARRGLLSLPGVQENVGLIGLHYRGEFIELVPWQGPVSWAASPWGRWRFAASNEQYEAVVEAETEAAAGTPLRAPTAEWGLAPFCRDSFAGCCTLTLWRRSGGVRVEPPIAKLTSTTAAVEVGGGPWWDSWECEARMTEPLGSLVKLPLDVKALTQWLPQPLRPPGL